MLTPALEQVRDRIARYRDRSSSIGEQNTKAALIEPILRALGWDIEDPEEVWREYRRRSVDNPVDYALMILRTPRVFVGRDRAPSDPDRLKSRVVVDRR